MNHPNKTPETRLGQWFFSIMSHALYDLSLYRFVTPYIWRCPTARLMDSYVENITATHLEIGVGNGYFSKRTLCADFVKRLVLDCVLAEKYAEREVELIDARDASALMDEITQRGLDIDEGMLVEVDGELHYGADAIHVLAKIGLRKGVFNTANRVLFKNGRVARLVYPMLRSCRNLLLKLLGIKRINKLGVPGRDKL